MSRTERTNYKGETIRDGSWGRRCPDPQCDVCGTGLYKGTRSKWVRRTERQHIEEELEHD